MTLSRADVRHVAMLARIGLEPGEEEFYVEQLGAILTYIDRLSEVDTESIPPTAQAGPTTNRLREDVPLSSLGQGKATMNAPEARDGLFVVRSIQEAEP